LEAVEVVLEAMLKVLGVMLYTIEVVNGVRCLLWVLVVMLCMQFYVLLCILYAAEGELCLLSVLEVIRCVLLCILEAVEGLALFAGGVGDTGGDALRASLYARGYGGYVLFAGDVGGAGADAPCTTLYARGCGR